MFIEIKSRVRGVELTHIWSLGPLQTELTFSPQSHPPPSVPLPYVHRLHGTDITTEEEEEEEGVIFHKIRVRLFLLRWSYCVFSQGTGRLGKK